MILLLVYNIITTYCYTTKQFETDVVFSNCVSVVEGSCQICEFGYFLFQLPQKNDALGLRAGVSVCVMCPYQGFSDSSNLYCANCIDNSQYWNSNRICNYDYQTSDQSNDKSTFHKLQQEIDQLYYVIEKDNKEYSTIQCDGCAQFCKSQSESCSPVADGFTYDTNNLYIQCKDGYAYNEDQKNCEACPQNCQSCVINFAKSFDSNGALVNTVTKQCLICNDGFSLMTLRDEVDSLTIYTECISCFEGCTLCYFGKNGENLNEKSWDQYNNDPQLLYSVYNTTNNVDDFFTQLFEKFGIAQRCITCSNSTTTTFMASLDRKSCQRCGTSCKECEYVSYTLDEQPTRDSSTVVEPTDPLADDTVKTALESKYILRCRECSSFSQAFLAVGTGCFTCTITNCIQCSKVGSSTLGSDDSFNTINSDFEPLTQENLAQEQCIMCQDSYYLSEDAQTCTLYTATDNCLTSQLVSGIYQCLKCNTGYTLYYKDGLWQCTFTCSNQLQDPVCQQCILNTNGVYRCQNCLDGYYVDLNTGKCQQCQLLGYTKQCFTLSLTQIHYPLLRDFELDGDTIKGPYPYLCFDSTENIGPILNNDIRTCEKGGEQCTQYVASGKQGQCTQCISSIEPSRSSTDDDQNCMKCPQGTIGCTIRTQQQINVVNKFFIDSSYCNACSTLAYKCIDGYFLDTSIQRCTQYCGTPLGPCNYEQTLTLYANCNYITSINDQWNINEQFDSIKSDTTTIALEDILDDASKINLFQQLNDNAITKVTINLIFKYAAGNDGMCFFRKKTYITSNLQKYIFTLSQLELIISIDSDDQSNQINWYIQDSINFQYFSSVTISNIVFMPAQDYKLSSQIPKYLKPYSLNFYDNVGLKIKFVNIKITNLYAENYYLDQLYTTPDNDISISRKKLKQFYMNLLNVYDFQIFNSVISSQNYKTDSDLQFQPNLFTFQYDQDIQFKYSLIKLTNVKFQDISIDEKSFFELQNINMSTLQQWNRKFYLNNIIFQDMIFQSNGGFITTNNQSIPMGMILINQLKLNNVNFNSSLGIVSVTNMQKVQVNSLNITNCNINYTNLFYITTLDMYNIHVSTTQFLYLSKLINTQFDIQTYDTNIQEFSGERIKLSNLIFDSIQCLSPGCIMMISSIKNEYEIPLNVTLDNILIENINTTGYNETILTATTSAAIQIEKCYQVTISNFESKENANLVILYINQNYHINVYNLHCYQNEGLEIYNNYCLFIENFYEYVYLYQIKLENLNALDNSLVGIFSWNNNVYNTSSDNFNESVYIDTLIITNNKFTTSSLSTSTTALLLQSTQFQQIKIINTQFINNQHITTSNIKGTLKPSNPTLLIESLVGTLQIQDSFWKNNSGTYSVVHLICNNQILTNLQFKNNNYNNLTLSNQDPLIMGGHLYLSGSNIQLNNSIFSNSTAKDGGAIYLQSSLKGNINITNITINYAITQLKGRVASRGGCIFIDSRYSELNLTLNNLNLQNCYSRAEGGAIYIESSDQQQNIAFQLSTIENCHSLEGILKIKFDDKSTLLQQSNLNLLSIYQEQQSILSFLISLGNLTDQEQYQLLTRAAIIEQDNGQIYITNCYFENIYSGVISLSQPKYFQLYGISVNKGQIWFGPMIQILSPIQQQIKIEQIQFKNITEIQPTCKGNLQGQCVLFQAIINFSNIKINPSLLFIESIPGQISLSNIFLYYIYCTECYGGLIQVMGVPNSDINTQVLIESCQCQNSILGYYGCFVVSNNLVTIFQTDDAQLNTTFISQLSSNKLQELTGLTATQTTTPRLLQTQNYSNYQYYPESEIIQVVINSLNIQNTTSFHGAGITIININTNITKMYCADSIAKGQGGCVLFEALQNSGPIIFQRLNVVESIIKYNTAQIGGGIRIKNSGLNNQNLTNNEYVGNTASLFGNHYSEYPTSLNLEIEGMYYKMITEGTTRTINNTIIFDSNNELGSFLNITINSYFEDSFGNKLPNQTDTTIEITSSEQNILKGETKRLFNNQGFQIDNIIVSVNPYENKNYLLTINSSDIRIPVYGNEWPYTLVGYDTEYTINIPVKARICKMGEEYNSEAMMCLYCQDNYYSLQPQQQCKLINREVMLECKTNQIKLKSSYWRLNSTTDEIIKCENYPLNCNGGYEIGNDICITGTIGPLCEECDIESFYWEDKYFQVTKYKCKKCSERSYQYFIIMILFYIISLIICIVTQLDIIKDNSFRIPYLKDDNVISGFIKTFIHHFQIFSLLQYLQNEINGNELNLASFSMPIQIIQVTFDCDIITKDYPNIMYARIIWTLIIFLIFDIFAILLIARIIAFKFDYTFRYNYLITECSTFHSCLNCILKCLCYIFYLIIGSNKLFLIARICSNTLLFTFIYIMPSILLESFRLIKQRIIAGEIYFFSNVNYLYQNSEIPYYYLAFSIFLILFISYHLSLGFLQKQDGILTKFKVSKVTQSSFQLFWGILYLEYNYLNKHYRFFTIQWEMIKIIIKCAIIIITIGVSQPINIIFGIILLLLYFISLIIIKPYKSNSTFLLEFVSSLLLIIIYLFTIILQQVENQVASNIFQQLILAGNIIFVFFFIILMVYFLFIEMIGQYIYQKQYSDLGNIYQLFSKYYFWIYKYKYTKQERAMFMIQKFKKDQYANIIRFETRVQQI